MKQLQTAAQLLHGALEHVRLPDTTTTAPPLDPLSPSNYKQETYLIGCPFSVEDCFAVLFVCLLGSVPILLAMLLGTGKLTTTHLIESGCLLTWLVSVVILFTNFVSFVSLSGHFDGARPLTVVECVYFLAQIITTVGYGDITPANPVAQIWVGTMVLLVLPLYGSIIMEVQDLATQRVELAMSFLFDGDKGMVEEQSASPKQAIKTNKIEMQNDTIKSTKMELIKSIAAFSCMVFCGVMFWHYFPGEEKTWLQAVYMSIITLSTVGFGAFTATTPGGMVFGAFWMLFGVSSLAAVIAYFVQLMVNIKAQQRMHPAKVKLAFYDCVEHCCNFTWRPRSDFVDKGMDSYEFLKFSLLCEGSLTIEEVTQIEDRWRHLCPDETLDGTISNDVFLAAEAPPGFVEDLRSSRGGSGGSA